MSSENNDVAYFIIVIIIIIKKDWQWKAGRGRLSPYQSTLWSLDQGYCTGDGCLLTILPETHISSAPLYSCPVAACRNFLTISRWKDSIAFTFYRCMCMRLPPIPPTTATRAVWQQSYITLIPPLPLLGECGRNTVLRSSPHYCN